MKEHDDLWVWIRVPLSALERAMDALKERVASRHWWGQRDEANSDSKAAKDIKDSLRITHEDDKDGNTTKF
jgi:hypothetical protein